MWFDLIFIGFEMTWFDIDIDWICFDEGLIWFDKIIWDCKKVNVRFEWKSNVDDSAPMSKVQWFYED